MMSKLINGILKTTKINIRSSKYTEGFMNLLRYKESTKRGVLKWSSLGVLILVISPVADRYLKERGMKAKNGLVFKKLELGSKPRLPTAVMQERNKEFEQLQRAFLPHTLGQCNEIPSRSLFGLLVGPSGTGKTVAITHLCNKFPEGVVYCEVREPFAFPATLATEVGMKLNPFGLLDLVLSHISTEYALYHKIPQDPYKALNYVLSTIQKSAITFEEKHGYVPTLFIDGADLLAKNNENFTKHLISHAKILSNENILRIVLISSEGSVIPLLGDFSHMNRSTKLMEIGDISDEDAKKFLDKYIKSQELCAKLVAYFGGRFVYLVQCIGIYEFYAVENSSTDIFWLIKNSLLSIKWEKQYVAIVKTKPLSTEVLKVVSQKQNVNIKDILSAIAYTNTEDVIRVVSELVRVNILRYTTDGHLTFHGRPEQHEFSIQVHNE